MDGLSLVLGLASALLVAAGLAKLARPGPTAAALAAVGVGTPYGGVRVLGGCEVALGAAALLTGNEVLALAVGIAYVAFTGFVVLARRPGRDVVSCGCFGTLGASPNWSHVVLNLTLSAGSVGAAIVGSRSLIELTSDLPLAVMLVGLGALGCWLALAHRIDAVPSAAGAAGAVADVDLQTGRTALVFLTTTCVSCRAIWAALGASPSPLPAGVRPVVVTTGDETLAAVRALAPPGVLTVRDSAAWARYGVSAAPAVVLVDDGQVVSTGVAHSWDDVVALSAS
ncbi:MAG: TlpA family protein disulfide reductase [Acidimicrobiales bacterium]